MQVSFNKRTILPTAYTNDKGTYLSTTIFSPVRYNIKLGTGLMPTDQIQAVLEQCAENAQEVEIEFTETQGRFGPELTIFSVKPLPKKTP